MWTKRFANGSRWRTLAHLVSLTVAGVLVFSGRFDHGFVWDDALFRDGTEPVLQAGLDLATTHTNLYRPLRVLGYTVLFALSGRNPAGYHVFATLVHVLAVLGVYGLLRSLRLPGAWLGALLFALHPVHIESIVFITASFDQIAVVLYVASVAAFVLGMRGGKAWFGVALNCEVLALLGSEFAATLPLAVLLVGVFLRQRDGLRLPKGIVAGYWVLLAGYLVVRFEVLGLGARSADVLGGSRVASAATTAVIFGDYLRLMLWPWPSCVIYRPEIHTGFLEPAPALWTGVLLGLTGLSLRSLLRGRSAGLGFLWGLLTLGPVSNLVPSTTPMAERYLYLSSVGLSLAVAGCERLRRPGWKSGMVVAAAGILTASGVTSWMRAQIWENEIRLFDKARECLPDNVHVWVELLRAQLEAGQVREAWQSLNEIRRLRSSQPGGDLGDVELALCGILLKSGHPKEAEEMARVALQRHPGTAALWGNLGEALLRQGRPEEARSALEQGTKLEPQQSEFWASLAEAQLVLGQRDEGLASLERAIQGPRPSSRACFNLGVLLERQNPRQAAVHFRTYLGLEPQASDAHQVRQRIARLDAIAGP